MSGWENLPTDIQAETNFENYMDKLAEPMPEAPKPVLETKLVDFATEAEAPKTYVVKEDEQKPFEKRKEDGFSMSEPVNVYEPGFRSDMYEAIVNYFKQQRKVRENNQRLREKIGLRG